MKKFYILPLLLLISVKLLAQPCSALDFSYVSAESRCMATGSITVTVTGGSGSYTYKVIGPVSPAVTSSNIITGLPAGYYSIQVKDVNTGCIVQKDSAQVGGSYSDPRFQLTETDVTCLGNDGTVSVMNQQFGRSPFSYTIISPSPSSVGVSNTTGSFTSLIPGEYYVQLSDSCGGIQVRRVTVQNYNWSIDNVTAVKISCDSAQVNIFLIDNKGRTNSNSSAFNGFIYGVVNSPGDTTWFTNSSFKAFVSTSKQVNIVAKDNCGTIHSYKFPFPASALPSMGPVALSAFTCSTFTATVTTLQNFSSPSYCLLDSAGNYYECSSISGIFSNIPYGRYCIQVHDACFDTTVTSCFSSYPNTPSVDAAVAISNQTCSTFTATITGQNNLRNPFFCIYDSLNNNIACDSTGIFTNLPYGNYCIKINVTCPDSTIARCFSSAPPVPVITSVSFSNITCSSFTVTGNGNNLQNTKFCLYDSLGNVIACDSTGSFPNVPPGNYCIKAIRCSDTSTYCFTGAKPIPAVAPNVQISNKTCTGFTASITGQSNLTNPLYCLYDSTNTKISCDSTGQFVNIPYGSYCIKITDGCTDTTISRCFSTYQPLPSIAATMQVISTSCSTLSFRVTGTNLTNPGYCVYDSLNNQLSCDSTGIFNNLPYGSYCVKVHDGCIDTTLNVCQSFIAPRGLNVTSTQSCTLNVSTMSVRFTNPNGPFHVKFYHPNGSVIKDTISSSNPVVFTVPALPVGGQYKVIGTDSCGNIDSTLVTPVATTVSMSAVVSSKCPSGSFLNGAGDILASSISNLYAWVPQIISKNGVNDPIDYSNHTGNIYKFSNLGPATYVVEFTMQTCNIKLKDTLTVNPYAYPSQGQSAIYQCDNNGFSLDANVSGGVGPYTYQIIGSQPASPDISTAPQANPIFNINNGTTYSLVRLRSIDACGNATLNDVSVLPLQNLSIKASSDCYYQNIVLTTDTIPNATYTWYQRTSATDSVIIDSGLSHNFPFFLPEQTGQYIVKANVNEGCVTRLAYIDLSGNCNYQPLAVPINLLGKISDKGNVLTWTDYNEKNITSFTIERKSKNENDFHALGSIAAGNSTAFQYLDNDPPEGINRYRLHVIYSFKEAYTHEVALQNAKSLITIYPNPAVDVIHISINSDKTGNYRVEILSANGQKLYVADLNNCQRLVYDYPINKSFTRGIYLVKVTNLNTGLIEIRKVLIQ